MGCRGGDGRGRTIKTKRGAVCYVGIDGLGMDTEVDYIQCPLCGATGFVDGICSRGGDLGTVAESCHLRGVAGQYHSLRTVGLLEGGTCGSLRVVSLFDGSEGGSHQIRMAGEVVLHGCEAKYLRDGARKAYKSAALELFLWSVGSGGGHLILEITNFPGNLIRWAERRGCMECGANSNQATGDDGGGGSGQRVCPGSVDT